MLVLSPDEAVSACDAFLLTVYGAELMDKWIELKSEMEFLNERDFMAWLLELAREYRHGNSDQLAREYRHGNGDQLAREYRHGNGDQLAREYRHGNTTQLAQEYRHGNAQLAREYRPGNDHQYPPPPDDGANGIIYDEEDWEPVYSDRTISYSGPSNGANSRERREDNGVWIDELGVKIEGNEEEREENIELREENSVWGDEIEVDREENGEEREENSVRRDEIEVKREENGEERVENIELRDENIELREENSVRRDEIEVKREERVENIELREENIELREENIELREENSAWRDEIEVKREENGEEREEIGADTNRVRDQEHLIGENLSHQLDFRQVKEEVRGQERIPIVLCERLELPIQDNSHTGMEKLFKCNSCFFSTKSRLNLMRHKKTHSSEPSYNKCGVCEYATNHSSHLKRHMLRRHGIGELVFHCNKCDYKTLENRFLKQHMLTHKQNKPPRPSNLCKYSTKYASSRIHEVAEYRCETCAYSTSAKDCLIRHMVTHHSEGWRTRSSDVVCVEQPD